MIILNRTLSFEIENTRITFFFLSMKHTKKLIVDNTITYCNKLAQNMQQRINDKIMKKYRQTKTGVNETTLLENKTQIYERNDE